MLVLTRKEDERIVLTLNTGETIVVTVCDIAGNSVKLGIEAPPAVGIWREEIAPPAAARGPAGSSPLTQEST